MGEEQGDGARPATDVEEAPTTIEVEVFGESIGQRRCVWFATLPVVVGSALEHGFVPDPVFPRVARLSLRHVFSVSDPHGDGLPPFAGCGRISGTKVISIEEPLKLESGARPRSLWMRTVGERGR